MQTFAGRKLRRFFRGAGWARLGLLCLAGWTINVAQAQPANDNFANAAVISGATGTTNGSNVGATLETPCETNTINTDDNGLQPVTNSVWYAWTAPATGTALFNTVGSSFDTVLAIWTTANPAGGLCDPSVANIAADDDSGGNLTSALTFPVVAGTTYYVAVEGNVNSAPDDSGGIVLNWSEVPSLVPTISSGTFRFATSQTDPSTGEGLYVVSESDSTAPSGLDGGTVNPTILGARVTVTRTGGSSGRAMVDYTVSGLTYMNIFRTNYYATNIVTTYIATNGTFITNLTFTTIYASNSYEYYADGYKYASFTNALTNLFTVITVNGISITNPPVGISPTGTFTPVPTNLPPLNLSGLTNYFPPLPPLNVSTNIISIVLDTNNNPIFTNLIISVTNVFQPPSVISNQFVTSSLGLTLGQGTLSFDDYQMSQDFLVPVNQSIGPDFPTLPNTPSLASITLSNPRLDSQESADLLPPTVGANSTARINGLNPAFEPGTFNFERSTFRVDENVNGGNAVVSVTYNGATPAQVGYRIDYGPPANSLNTFPLQAGSDYATPNVDFTSVTGTLTFGTSPQTISVPITNTNMVEFYEDMQLQLYQLPNNPPVGEVGTATLTILNKNQPAGAVDRTWNQNNAADSNPPFINYPGTTGNGGTVYAVAEQSNGDAIIAGSFNSFDQNTYNRIVRVLPNGYQDPTFLAAPNSGANDFIAALALYPAGSTNFGKILIGGNFTSFNGNSVHRIARLNSDGSLDTTFNPGLGANGMVWSIALQSNGQIILGGDFTMVNGINLNNVARLNADGSVDTSFNPGVGPDGTVNAVALDAVGNVIIGGSFDTVSGVNCGGVARLSVNGTLDTTFAPGIGTYNPDTLATDPVYALAVQPNGQILIAGGFSYLDLDSYNGIVRLNPDGTLDLSFNPGKGTLNPVTGDSDTIYAMILQPDGNILIGGDFTTFNQTRRVGVARLYADGTVDTSFMDTAYNQFAGLINNYHNPNAENNSLYPATNERNFVYALALESGGNVIIGGGFLVAGGDDSYEYVDGQLLSQVVNAELLPGFRRDAILPRSNVARLVGGATAGPGNIAFSYNSYSVAKNAGLLYVSLVRNSINSVNPGLINNLGTISATFSTILDAPGPGIASGSDFSLGNQSPTWPSIYEYYSNGSGLSWDESPGIYGPNYDTIPVQTVPPDAGPAIVALSIYNDGLITGNLNANLELSQPIGNSFTLGGEVIPLGAALGALTAAPLTIIDDNYNAGVLGFSSPQFTVTEHGGSATITVTRTNGTQNVVQVNYATSNGTATNGIDFTNVSGTLTFNTGDTSKTFTVPIIPGTTIQPDKTVNLTLYTPTGGAQLGLSSAVLTIINDNFTAGQISFTSTNFSTNETSGTALVTLSRLGGSSGTIKVTLLTAAGSAVPGVDYSPYSNTITWNNGNKGSPITVNIAIPVFHDAQVTSNRTVNLLLTNLTLNTFPTNACWGPVTNSTLTILNVDSAGTVQFSSPVYSVKKSAGYALIPVVRTGGSVGTITVSNFTVSGTAIGGGVNYSNVAGTLTFTNGQIGQFIQVPVVDNGISNGLTSLTLVLSNAQPAYALGSVSNATLNIIDTDSVNEPPGSGDVTYDSLGLNNTVYALALQGNNQLLVGGDFTIADGVPRQRIARFNSNGTIDPGFSLPSSSYGANDSVRAIAVQSDGRILVGGFFTNFNNVVQNHIARLNSDGTLDSQFTIGSGADNAVYALAQTFVNGAGKILVAGAFANIGGSAYNSIARLNGDDSNGAQPGSVDTSFNPGLGANATVYALAVQGDGKVVIGGDFTAVNGNTNFNHIARLNTDGSVDTNFLSGMTGASGSVHAIAIQLDGRILIGGYFTNVNGAPLNYIARLNTDGSVDANFNPGAGASDPVFSIALQADTRIVLGGEFTTCSGVSRSRITRLNPDGTVDPTINFGTGANNFVAAVVVQEDTIFGYPTNVPDEKIIIGGGFTEYNGQPHAYLARIYGGSMSGVGAFEFSSSEYGVDEQGTNVVITILRTGGTSGTNANGSGDIIVPFTTSDGTAVAGTNYLAVTNNLDFPEGEVIRTVTIPVLDDGVITPNLTVNLAVNPPLLSEFGQQPTALLWITNDDSAINFSYATYTVAKNAVNGAATIGIVRQGSVSGTSTVLFSTTASGTATAGLDFYPTNVFVTFNPGVSNVLVTVPIINNGIAEGNQTVGLQLSGASGSALYSPSNAVLTIIDTVSSPGQLSLSATNYVVTEGGGVGYTNAYITVLRNYGSLGAVSASFTTMDGTALSGAKYIATNGVVSFGDGETTPKTFAVQVINTPTAEGPEYLYVLLTNATDGATLAAPTNATLTILNTNTGVAFASAVNTFPENGGTIFNGNPDTVFISVLRFNNTNVTTQVTYATADGTAQSNVNYVATGGTVIFNPGDSAKTIPVELIHDTNVTGTLTFTLNLSNPTGGAQLTPPSTTVIQELDAEAGLSFLTNATSVLKTAGYVFLPVISSNPNVGPVSVNYSTGGGTAAQGVDYTPVNGTLLFTNGQFFNYIEVPIIPNSLVESNLTFNVTLSSPVTPGVLVPPSTETVTIIETNTPPGLNIYSPIVTNGDWGSVSVDNNSGVFGAPMAWFAWTPTNSGEVEFDTIGSVDDVAGITNLATAMTVYTGTSIATGYPLAANGGLFAAQQGYVDDQYNYSGQNIFNLAPTVTNGMPVVVPVSGEFYQHLAGPSQVRFNAVAGQTYYIAVQTYQGYLSYGESGNPNTGIISPFAGVISPPAGLIKLNWALHPSGVFQFAQEDLDETGMTYSNGIPMLLYRVSETEETRRPTGTVVANQYDSTLYGTTGQGSLGRWGYDFDVPGLLVSVTRVAGSSGRVQVGYTTKNIAPSSSLMGNNGYLVNGDLPASSMPVTNVYVYVIGGVLYPYFTNITAADFTPVSGVLTFDDSEMTKDIFIPIADDGGVPRPNRDFLIVLTNAALDSAESTDVQPPRLDTTYSTTLVRILDADISPQGPAQVSMLVTNFNPILQTNVVTTNIVWNIQPTNGVFNFEKAHYRVTRDITNYWGGTPITLYVNRMGTNNAASPTIHWRVNSLYLDNSGDADLGNPEFPLQPGSDYATPNPVDSIGVLGLVPDFQVNGGNYAGTISFPAGKGAFNPQPITFTVYNNGLQQFNEDFMVSLYAEDSKNNVLPVGMVDQTTVTILYDDLHPPAGSVDEFYNADWSQNMAGPFLTVPPQMSHPGTDGEVYGLAVQPDNKTIIVGDFATYDQSQQNNIARINTDGSLDTTFNPQPNSGPNGFVRCIALAANNESVIGGAFSSYNGTLRSGIALVTANGVLDTSFNPGNGFNGTVYTVAVPAPIRFGAAIGGIGGAGSTTNEFDNVVNLGSNTAGFLTVNYNFGAFTNDMQIFYGNPNVAAGTGVLIYDTGYITGGGTIARAFGPVGGLTTNLITIVMNPGGNPNGPAAWSYSGTVAWTSPILVGGNFTSYNGVPRKYLARLNADGSLDTTFDPGTNLNATVYAVAMQSSGQLIVGGDFTSAGGVSGQDHIARLNSDGSFDPSFDPGSGANASVLALGLQPDGNIVVGGEFSQVNGRSASNIARLDANGFTDPNFFSGVGLDGPVNNITVNTSAIGSTAPAITTVQTNSDGVLQTNTTPTIVQTNFTIYVGGAFTAYNGTHRLGFARLNADGTVDTTFLDTAYNQFAGLPRDHYNDPLGTVMASGIQSDGNVMIGGSFERVGGGQSDDVDVRPESIDTNDVQIAESYGFNTVQKTRNGIRNRSNIARLIGGATPGPGNIALLNGSYSINKSSSPLYVSIVRTNGTLGPASANFAVLPGLAQNGVDYSYSGLDPLYWISWELDNPMGRMHSDGLFGNNGYPQDVYNRISGNGQSSVTVAILDNTNSLSNLSAQFQLTDPLGADQFFLGGEDIPLGVALGESAAPLTLIDDHQTSGTFGFSSPGYTGTGQGATISVVRTNGSYGVVYLSYATTTNGSTAILNSDYSAASGTMTFQPSDTSHTFTVPILNTNTSSSAEKTVNLILFGLNPPFNGIASWGLSNAVLRIINPNYQGFLNLSTNAYAANLSAGSVTVTVTRTVGSEGSLSVQFATADGTAVSGQDYFGTNTTLQWNSGDVTPRIITIPFINHNTNGPTKQFGVNLFNPALNGVSAPSLFATNGITNAVVFINNDNSYGAFQFSAPGYIVNDNGGYSTVTVIRTGGTNGFPTVRFTTADATAFAGTNYVRTTNTLTFVPGQLATNITVPILDVSNVVEPPPGGFYFTVSLSNPSAGASLGSPAAASVSIVDSESYNRPPGSPDTTFNTGTGMSADVFALALQSSGQILAGGVFTAVNGVPESYIARLNSNGSLDRSGFLYGLSGASAPVYALADQTDDQILVGGAFTNFNGTILNRIARLNTDGTLDSSFNPGAGADNTVYALAETFIGGVRKIYTAGAFASMNGNATPFVARLNNDGTVDTGFGTGVGPNAAVYAVAVYPTNSPLAGKMLIGGAFTGVNNVTVGHVARLNVDGSMDTNFDSNLVVGAGDIVRAIAIQNDGRVLIGGDFTNVNGVALNHIARLNLDGSLDAAFASTNGVGVGANASVSALALQADSRIVVVGQFTRASGVTRNGITRLLPTGAMDPTINFGDGANGAVDAVVVQPADQMLVIGGGFTQYDDQPAGHVARIYGGSVTGSGAFMFNSPTYQVDETGSYAVISIRRTGGTSGTNNGTGSVFVNFATITNGSTAVAGVNYSNVNVQVGFPAGEVLESVLVPVLDDSNMLANLTVNLSLSNPTNLPAAGLGNQTNAVLTIINDNSTVSFGSASYSVPKNIQSGVGTIDIARLGSSSGACSVNLITTTNGTAQPGVDFYPTNLTVNFNPGQTDVVVQIQIINNNNAGPDLTVIFALTNAVNTLITTNSISTTTLTINNTVTAAGQLSFAATNFAANASDGFGYLTVVRSGGSSGTVSANYTTADGTAKAGVNYTASSGTVTLTPGLTNATISVKLLNNTVAEAPVSLSVMLSTNQDGSSGATLIAPTNATLTIFNTNAVIAFAAATNTFSETAGTVFITVARFNTTSGSNSVHYATADGTAQAGVNYVSASGTVTFGPGQSLVTIPVTLIHDTNVTGTVAFTVNLSNPTAGAQLAAPSTTLVQELDAEAGLNFTTNAVSVPKNIGGVLITVICSNPGIEPVIVNSNTVPLEVNYATADGTATAGRDYTGTSGILVFTNGIGTNSFTVPVLNNSLITGSRTFSVSLTNVTAPGVIIPPSSEAVTIVDYNSGLSFSSPAYTVLRSGVSATITVVRTDNTNTTSSVNFATANGTAVAGTDYVATNGVLVFTNGVVSQTFPVTVIPSATVQPDKTVLLQLSAPVNGILIAPSAATLTIHDTSGSYVVPAGSTLISESGAGAPNGIIDSNETVTLLFAFRDAGGNDVSNLVARLIATSGVTPVSPVTNTYGQLKYKGHSVSRPFTFTAIGTNGQQIAATFLLTNVVNNIGTNIGTAIFSYTLGSWIATYSNTAPIYIPYIGAPGGEGPASPYPSIINVSGLSGTVIKTTLTLTNVTHTSPSDIDAMLVAPDQLDTLFMAHAGGENGILHVTLTFDDAATNFLSQYGQITNGVYKPTNYPPVTPFP
jgi:uncharacterized delta-60 repeat protein